jgi:hypothetical protein
VRHIYEFALVLLPHDHKLDSFKANNVGHLQQFYHHGYKHHHADDLSGELHVLRPNDDVEWDQWAIQLYQGSQLQCCLARGWDHDGYGGYGCEDWANTDE